MLDCIYMSVASGFALEQTGYMLYVSDTCMLIRVAKKIMIFLKKSKKSDLFDLNQIFFDLNRFF